MISKNLLIRFCVAVSKIFDYLLKRALDFITSIEGMTK